MDQTRARVRISLTQGEIELEGSEAFIRSYADRLEGLFERLEQQTASASDVQVATRSSPPGAAPAPAQPSQNFGERLQALPRSVTDVDRILLAGHHAQGRSPDRSFATGEANALLTEQGIKVGNPSQCVKQNLLAKRVFKHQGRYRVSQQGTDHLRQLLGAAFQE